MSIEQHLPKGPLKRVRRAIGVTYGALWFERLVHAFWPVLAFSIYGVGVWSLGLFDVLPTVAHGPVYSLATLLFVFGVYRGARRFVRPTRAHAISRVDANLVGRPLQALSDTPVSQGRDSGAQTQIWRAHIERMASNAMRATPVLGTINLRQRDPYALRLMAVFIFASGLLFGTLNGAPQSPATGSGNVAMGPVWEGWVAPPAHTGKPTLYMADLAEMFHAPQGSEVTMRLYTQDRNAAPLTVRETVSGPTERSLSDFNIVQSGEIEIEGQNGRLWEVALQPDRPPVAAITDEMARAASGEARLPFRLDDDFGVIRASVIIVRDTDKVPQKYGYIHPADPRPELTLSVPLPQTGDRTEIEGVFAENLSKHPFSGLPVKVTLRALDASGQWSADETVAAILPGRKFFDPLAGALIDLRRELLWSERNTTRTAQVLRASLYVNENIGSDATIEPRIRGVIGKLEAQGQTLDQEVIDAIAEELWAIAELLEYGELAEALARLRRAQERLQQAMRDGANKEEIARLMQELRDATQQYLEQLAEQQGDETQDGSPEEQSAQNEDTRQLTQDQIQELMDRIQELMEQGRMAEAQALMDMLNELLQNLRVTQNQNGQGGQGSQSMQNMQDMMREQQELNDDTFADLQNRFGPQGEQEGEGAGQSEPDGAPNGQEGTGENPNDQPSREGAGGRDAPQPDAGTLSERQEALRRQLEQQRQQLSGGENGAQVDENLDDAGRAMREAEDALRDGDLSGALDRQAEAMQALREGYRQLGQEGQRDQADAQEGARPNGQDGGQERRDPLGRTPGDTGVMGSEDGLADIEGGYRRAEELLDEIRKRSAEQERSDAELDYLKRLLERF